ncbi:MAG: protein kinase domain-containing protein [Nocardioidaceae bacterium]
MRHLGRYRLDEPLGSGAFATVWKAFDPELDSVVAVKVLADNWATNADVCERFLAEARLLRRISHPAVVRVHDVGTAPGDDGVGRPYFVMDLVTGGP